MSAVIWTDVIQMCLYVTGAVVSFFVILSHIGGGWNHVAAVAGALGKFRIFDFHFSPTLQYFSQPYTFWAGILGGAFLTMASHGTDQLMVQRLLSARDERQSRTALLASWAVIAVQFTLFLLIGILLFVFYQDRGLHAPAEIDRIYPAYLWQYLPPGLAGLTIAAILAAAMANLSAALNSLAATTVVDLLRGFSAESRSLWHARIATVLWGAVLLVIGILARQWGSVLQAGLTIASIPSGALLGIFLLGVLTRKPGQRAAITGVIAGLTAVLYVRFWTPIAFTWYVLIGTIATFGGGWVASWFEAPAAEETSPAPEVYRNR